MSDIGSLLTAAAPAAAGPGGAAALPLGEVGLERLPQRLSQLSRPVVITGTVVGRTDDGATRVRTQAGEVVLRSAAPLPADGSVTLQIGAGQPPVRATAFLTSPPAAAGQPGANPGAAALAALPLPAGADEAAAPTLPGGVAARVAQVAAGAEAALPPPGTVVPGQVLSTTGRAPPAQTPQAGPAPPALPEGSPPALTPGAPVALRILGSGTVAGATAAGAGLGPGGGLVLTGTIAGTTHGGQPVLATAQGSLALAFRGPLPQGTKLSVELLDPRQLVFSHPAEGAAAASRWPALAETLTTLGGLEGALAQTLLGSVVPQPNRKLAAALAFFLDAARRGEAREWLGEEAAEALESEGRGDLTRGLGEEFRAMARDAGPTPPGEWRSLAFPLFDGGVFQRVELHVKAPGGDEESGTGQGGGERSHRFLLDLELSRLGALQLDGLVKAKSRRFDLILRSRQPLPDPLRAELFDAFAASLDAVGYGGGLAFQPGGRSWVKPPPSARRPGSGVVA